MDLTAAEANQIQVSDAAIFGVIHVVSPAEANQVQVSDGASLSSQAPTFQVAAAEGNQAQVSDAAALGVYHVISPAQNNQAQVSDAAALGVYHVISPAEANQSQSSDAATLGAFTAVTGTEVNQSQTSDAAILAVTTPITAAQANQAQVSDAASVTFSGISLVNITAAEANQAQVSDTVSISAYYPVTPSQQNQAQTSDAASLTAEGPTYSITADEAHQAQGHRIATCCGSIEPELGRIVPMKSGEYQKIDGKMRQHLIQYGVSVKPNEDWQVVDRHPVLDLLAFPNQEDSWLEFSYELHMFFVLCGEFWIWKIRNGLGKPAILWVVPNDQISATVEHKRHPNGVVETAVKEYLITPGGAAGTIKVPPEDIIRGRWKSPIAKGGAYSSTQAVHPWLMIAESIESAQYLSFSTGTHSDMFLMFLLKKSSRRLWPYLDWNQGREDPLMTGRLNTSPRTSCLQHGR